jgi:transcriptional regulator with XRE-family HTH domain
MSEEEYKRAFSRRLRHYLSINGKTQADLVKDLGFNKSTVSTWFNGVKIPRMDKIDILCDYFNISRSDLIEDKPLEPELTARDSKQIETILQNTREALTSQQGLMFDGEPATPEAIDSILNAMEIGMEMAKKKNKEKYTPKKYKKD